MKRFLVLTFISILGLQSYATDFSKLSTIELNTSEQYEAAQEQVLDCCYYLLSTPCDKKDKDRGFATQFIIRWIQGTPEYSFEIEETVAQMTGEKDELLSLYLTCYTKLTLESENPYEEKETIKKGAINAFLDYCGNSINKVRPTKEIKRMLEAREEGQLEAYINK